VYHAYMVMSPKLERRGRPLGSGKYGALREDAVALGVSAGHLRAVIDGERESPGLFARFLDLRMRRLHGRRLFGDPVAPGRAVTGASR